MTDHDDQPLRPAAFTPTSAVKVEPAPVTSAPKGLLIAIGVLLVLLLLVLFALPQWVSPVTPTSTSTVPPVSGNTSSTQTGASAPQVSSTDTGGTDSAGPSPFADAQRQKERRAAQEALQQALEVQEILLEMSVTEWAPELYNKALQQAAVGDTAYREGRFNDATAAYQRAFEQLLALEASIAQRQEQATTTVITAVEQGDEATANTALTALQLLGTEPSVLEPLAGRVRAIGSVQEALATAEAAVEAEDYGTALEALQQALSADPAHEQAARRQSEVVQLDTDFRFRQQMSAGYLALEQAAFSKAEEAFNRAATLKPGAPEPQAAQRELSDARIAARLLSLQKQGEQLVAQEQWQQAVTVYQEALTIDSTLTFAQQGIDAAQPRADLDRALRAIVEQQTRLTNPQVLAEAEATLAQAKTIPDPGPRLLEQVEQVSQTLSYAKTPVTVSLVSDAMTDVTVLRVQRLGTFTSTSLTLRPGQYTAMGVRTGYRDVRVNFEVAPGVDTVVEVRCEEAI